MKRLYLLKLLKWVDLLKIINRLFLYVSFWNDFLKFNWQFLGELLSFCINFASLLKISLLLKRSFYSCWNQHLLQLLIGQNVNLIHWVKFKKFLDCFCFVWFCFCLNDSFCFSFVSWFDSVWRNLVFFNLLDKILNQISFSCSFLIWLGSLTFYFSLSQIWNRVSLIFRFWKWQYKSIINHWCFR